MSNKLDRVFYGLVCGLVIAFFIFLGYVFVVYMIQGKPTQRQKDRSSIKQLQIQVNQLDTRVKILEAK
jgi:hypothetical protein